MNIFDDSMEEPINNWNLAMTMSLLATTIILGKLGMRAISWIKKKRSSEREIQDCWKMFSSLQDPQKRLSSWEKKVSRLNQKEAKPQELGEQKEKEIGCSSFLDQEKENRIRVELSFQESKILKKGEFCKRFVIRDQNNEIRKWGIIFWEDPINGDSSFKDVYQVESVFYDEKRKEFRRKKYAASSLRKQGEKSSEDDFDLERWGLQRLFREVPVMPNRLCDYSKGRRQAVKITLNGRSYYIHKFYPRGTLAQNIEYFRKTRKRFSNCFSKLFLALCKVHGRGEFYGDLKPENILIDEEYNPILMDMSGLSGKERFAYTPTYVPFVFLRGKGRIRKEVSFEEARLLDFFTFICSFEHFFSPNRTHRVLKKGKERESVERFDPRNVDFERFNRFLLDKRKKEWLDSYCDEACDLFDKSEWLRVNEISSKIAGIKNEIESLMERERAIEEKEVESIQNKIEEFLFAFSDEQENSLAEVS